MPLQSSVIARLESAGFSRTGTTGIGNKYVAAGVTVRLAKGSVRLRRKGVHRSSAYVHHIVGGPEAVVIVTGVDALVPEFEGLRTATATDAKGYPLWRGDDLEALLQALGV